MHVETQQGHNQWSDMYSEPGKWALRTKQSEKKHARVKHCHPFIYTENHKYNNEKQRNTEKNIRTSQKVHINKLTHKHNRLQQTRPDALRIIIHRRKMHYNARNNERNQRKRTITPQDAKNTHARTYSTEPQSIGQ